MARKVMIACALTGTADTPSKNPAVPVTPQQIAESGIAAAKAGAAIVHIHVRDQKTTGPSMELAHYKEVVDRIRDSGVDVVINLTTGAGARFVPGSNDPMVPDPRSTMRSPAERVAHIVELKPEICSIDMGSINMGNYVFVNTVPQIEEIAIAIRDAGVKPEIEVFEPGHIMLSNKMIKSGHFKNPPLFQICLGVNWGAPATPDTMKYMKDLLPTDATWFTFGCAAQQFPMVAQAMLYGGHVRVGLEDNLYLARGKLAPSNAALVEKAVSIIEVMGEELATPAEARQMLGLRKAA
jgi:uncharacterized protein (DUF849 family)